MTSNSRHWGGVKLLWTSKSKENKFISQYLVERIRKSSDFEVYPSKNEYIYTVQNLKTSTNKLVTRDFTGLFQIRE